VACRLCALVACTTSNEPTMPTAEPTQREGFFSQIGIVWSPDGQGAILQDRGEHPMLLYVPTDGSAVYDLSPVI